MKRKIFNARKRYEDRIDIAHKDAVSLGMSKNMTREYVSRIVSELGVGYLSEVVRLYRDIVCRNNMGFVSYYDNEHKIVKQVGFEGTSVFNYVKNNKKQEIVDQYKNARAMVSEISKFSEPIMGYPNILNTSICIGSHKSMINQINRDALMVLNSCINKGFQEPAIQLIRLMSDVKVFVNDKECTVLNSLDENELKDYLRKLIINYAKKSVYEDRSSFFDYYIDYVSDFANSEMVVSKLANMETNPEYLYKLIKSGKFGSSIDVGFIDELKIAYRESINSMRNSQKATRLRELKAFEKEQMGD